MEDKVYPYPAIITEDLVIKTHDFIIDRLGGLPGIIETNSIGGALSRIENRVYYEGLQDPIEVAAWYGYSIATKHCFVDGNKRTATLIMVIHLKLTKTNINLNPIPKELATIMEEVAENKKNQHDLAKWLGDLYIKQNSSTFQAMI